METLLAESASLENPMQQQRQSGFTLVELMLVVLIIGILGAVAMPAYGSYVMRTRLADAHSTLASAQPRLEQFWTNNRSYDGFDAEDAGLMPSSSEYFDYTLEDATDSTYTLMATGKGVALGFVYTINQSGLRVTVDAPDGWTTNDSCWVDRKEGLCTQ
jgi:type IV pilus assembly protein PilE